MTDRNTNVVGTVEDWMAYWERVRENVTALTCTYLPEDYDRMAMLVGALVNREDAWAMWADELSDKVNEIAVKLERAFTIFYAHSQTTDPSIWQRDECEICEFVEGGYREFFDWHTRAGTRDPDAPLPEGDPPNEPRPFLELLGTSLGRLRRLYRASEKMMDDYIGTMTEEEREAFYERGREKGRVWAMSAKERQEYLTRDMTEEERNKYVVLH